MRSKESDGVVFFCDPWGWEGKVSSEAEGCRL